MSRSHTMLVLAAALMLLAQPLGAAPLLHPQGSVTLLDSGLVLDREMPVPHGALMACSGQCFIESGGMLLVSADKTVFAVREEPEAMHVLVREGEVEFALRAEAKPVDFQTPFDVLALRPHHVPAGTESLVRGVLRVEEHRAVLSVTSGSLDVTAADGRRLVQAGSALILAQAVTEGEAGNATRGGGSGLTTTRVVAGAAVLGVVAGGAALIGSSDGGGGSEASPK